jgi:hypothetical protein
VNRFRERVVLLVAISATACLLASGCDTSRLPETGEPRWEEQIEAVRDGKTDEIYVSQQIIGDPSFDLLSGLTLRKLDVRCIVITPAGLEKLAEVKGLEHLVLRDGSFDDSAIAALAECKSLRFLNLPSAEFGDEGLASLKALPKLELLRFHSPNVTDEGMKHIAEFEALRFLHLIGVPITDAGLRHLETMTQLESLYVDDSRITDEGEEWLFRNLPELHVHINQQHSDRDPKRDSHSH